MKSLIKFSLFSMFFHFSGVAQINAADDYVYNVNAVMGGMVQQPSNGAYYFRVLLNDTVDGGLPYFTSTLTQLSTTNPGVTIDSYGYVIVDPTTPPGNYTVVYQLCRNSNLSDCDSATVFVEVCNVATPILSTTQPDCLNSNGAVTLSGLPSGNWTLTYRT
jgi:hypothetical protein